MISCLMFAVTVFR